jgi:hypothetical protein
MPVEKSKETVFHCIISIYRQLRRYVVNCLINTFA